MASWGVGKENGQNGTEKVINDRSNYINSRYISGILTDEKTAKNANGGELT